MSLSFPETYDELAILAHHGATVEELARRLAEREAMSELERFHADTQARSHCGPTLDDHRARWAEQDQRTPPLLPPHEAVLGEPAPDMPDTAYPPWAIPLDVAPMEVPTGPMAEVLAWVGDDRARALAAIEAENTRPDPRTSLLAKLAKVADG